MNILLTDVCNRRCSFCFAKGVHEHKGLKYMPVDDVYRIFDFLEKENIKRVNILGGEPTLHPNFIEICQEIVNRKLKLLLFTNGMVSEEVTDFLNYKVSDKTDLMILCNVTYSETDVPFNLKRRDYFLSVLRKYTAPGITIHGINFEYQYLFELIRKYLLKRLIRVGLAHPIVGCATNKFAPLHQYKALAIQLKMFEEVAIANKCVIHYDCGVPTCVSGVTGSSCFPIIDVGVDLSVWPCFPLHGLTQVKLFDFSSISELNEYFAQEVRKKVDVCTAFLEECNHCDKRQGCGGVCLAHRLR